MGGKIFISYRREDDAGHTGRLFDHLKRAFREKQLFLDVDSIGPGLKFPKVVDQRVRASKVVLAIIGERWLSVSDKETGRRRLDDPKDYVRIELHTALKHDKRLIPVLIGQTQMPSKADLPDELSDFSEHNAVRITHERFTPEAESLIRSLKEILNERYKGPYHDKPKRSLFGRMFRELVKFIIIAIILFGMIGIVVSMFR